MKPTSEQHLKLAALEVGSICSLLSSMCLELQEKMMKRIRVAITSRRLKYRWSQFNSLQHFLSRRHKFCCRFLSALTTQKIKSWKNVKANWYAGTCNGFALRRIKYNRFALIVSKANPLMDSTNGFALIVSLSEKILKNKDIDCFAVYIKMDNMNKVKKLSHKGKKGVGNAESGIYKKPAYGKRALANSKNVVEKERSKNFHNRKASRLEKQKELENERARAKIEKEEKIRQYKKKRLQKTKAISKRTQRGQPLMKDRMQLLLQQIQEIKKNV